MANTGGEAGIMAKHRRGEKKKKKDKLHFGQERKDQTARAN